MVTEEIHVVLRSGLISEVFEGIFIGEFLQQIIQLLDLGESSIILRFKPIIFFLHIAHIRRLKNFLVKKVV